MVVFMQNPARFFQPLGLY